MQVRARRAVLTGAAALLVATSAAACGGDEVEGPREGVTTQELTGDESGSFDIEQAEAGQRASLRVTVAEVLSADSFVVGTKDTDGDPLLVVAKDQPLEVGQELQVSGPLSAFDYDDLAASFKLGGEEVYRDFQDGLVLVADVVDQDVADAVDPE